MKEIWLAEHGHGEYTVHTTRAEADSFAKYALHSVRVIRMVPAVPPLLYLCCYKVLTTYSVKGHLTTRYAGIIFDDQGIRQAVTHATTMDDLHERLLARARHFPCSEVVDYTNKTLPGHVAALLEKARPNNAIKEIQ